jgi:hypothetical protein
MPYLINGQLLSKERIGEEKKRIAGHPQWQEIPDESERARRVRAAAEYSAANRLLVEQAAAADPRPIDPRILDNEVAQRKAAGGCRTAYDETVLRQWIERNLRMQRIQQEMTEDAPKPAAEEVEGFFQTYGDRFRNPELFRAAHIVKHIDREHSEEEARIAIEAALAELEAGAPFPEVAGRHSDCKDNGGDLGQFPAGAMVQEFEDALRAIEPGQRTGIFRTPFGFHIAQLHARTEPCQATFEDVRDDIAQVLETQKKQETFLRAIKVLESRAEIRQITDAEAEAMTSNPPQAEPAGGVA